MSTKEVDILTFDNFDTTVNLAEIPEEDKWLPNDVLVIENQPILVFPFVPSLKSEEPKNTNYLIPEEIKQ